MAEFSHDPLEIILFKSLGFGFFILFYFIFCDQKCLHTFILLL